MNPEVQYIAGLVFSFLQYRDAMINLINICLENYYEIK